MLEMSHSAASRLHLGADSIVYFAFVILKHFGQYAPLHFRFSQNQFKAKMSQICFRMMWISDKFLHLTSFLQSLTFLSNRTKVCT